MSNFACSSSLPTTAFSTKTNKSTNSSQNITQTRPPRNSRTTSGTSSHHQHHQHQHQHHQHHHVVDDSAAAALYNPLKPSRGTTTGSIGSHDDMDVHTLATASTSAATSSYSMTDDASDASEVGMEVVMSNSGGPTTTAASSNMTRSRTTNTTTTTVVPLLTHSFKAGKETFTIPDRYSLLRTVGSGAYGVVISAHDKKKHRDVAIKMVPRAFNDEVDAKRILREIKLMKHLHHENIVSILDMMPPQNEYLDDFNDVYIVADLMETDLHRIIYSKQTLSIDHVQYFVYQMLRGLKYIHSANVIHRDLKPSNLLVNSNCDLKICDFGLARGIHGDDDEHTMSNDAAAKNGSMMLTEYVVTRWYRAPEIMLACNEYSKPVDVWSVGCIFAELILRKPYFPGDDYIDQLTIIAEKLGKLPEQDLDFVTSEKAKRFMRKLPDTTAASFSRQFPGTPRPALDLLRRMLHIHPKKRITVQDALAHPFFAQLHSPQDEPSAPKPFDFSFEQEKLTRLRLKELIWREAGQFRPTCLPVPPTRQSSSSMDLHEA
mmetsp:Transcript_29069/g.48028  ORF Transcript_29069/g.48028 Transcript_29069/m.48028 type:complete len:545 (+) Transcript_29069:643-2277(+)|eukprot:CAMPEP_0119011830 /NCGR_PEP_ID=MMETSP1176-20130426/5912_1 /TAXON_ID=265551 /ORGANISM="Synedropsis recta cf, Strain CCMP1620" /LENGTH=544 /DNA_ID=CAMNT_0006964701 /DNA_START=570 /DNA_END=2204 /DNA_ORIENTATION=+